MNKKEAKLEVGQEVFIISRELEIEERKVHAVVFEEDEIIYQLDEHSCGGSERTEIFITKVKAEIAKQDFLDKLRFKVGDLVICKYKEYSRTMTSIGRVAEIAYNHEKPYKITFGGSEYTTDITDEDMIKKIKNEYIERFEGLKELGEEYEELKSRIDEVNSQADNIYDEVEKELGVSFEKHYNMFGSPREKIKFEDRFVYEKEEY